MNSKNILGFLWLMALFTCTKEVPLDQTVEEQKISNRTSDAEDIDWDAFKKFREKSTNGSDLQNNASDRWNHSRMLSKASTTAAYEDWWFYSTRRPRLAYRDYPGKPGVATWKEITPVSSDNRKSRKISPTASGILSSSWRLLSNIQNTIFFTFIGIVFSYMIFLRHHGF
ncbi:uncharacterized protein TNCT_628301 [Trichonephila clavata]|uniref:Lipoprotein n=1 Tax=Trichonephila clavata TaxID=2740835 RepID=A0A8X6M411_TRICU|nr:uncharacterized protein TNCT_628301 [Trichonephila clavata]